MLAKIYTQKKARDILSLWVGEISQQTLEPSLLEDFLDLATLDVAEVLNGATIPDYGRTTILNDSTSSYLAAIVTEASYLHTTRTIGKVAHGYTTSVDVGKRIAFWNTTDDPVTHMSIAQIESITDVDNFVVSPANLVSSISAPNCDFGVFTAHQTSTLSIASLKFSHLAMIRDTNNGEWIEKKNKEFQNLANYTQFQENIYYYRHGESIFIYEGTSASTIGTITLEYFGFPTLPSVETDYLDIRDIYVPLVIAKTKNYVYEHLQRTPPEALSSIIAQKTQQIRDANLSEKQAGAAQVV